MSHVENLRKLLAMPRSCIHISTYEEAQVLQELKAAAGECGRLVSMWSVNVGITLTEPHQPERALPNTTHPAAALEQWRMSRETGVMVALDLLAHLEAPEVLRVLRDLIETNRQTGGTLVLVDWRDSLPAVIAAYATPFILPLPDEAELDEVIREVLKKLNKERKVEVKLNREQYETVLKNLRGLTRRQAGRIIRDIVSEDHRLEPDDLNEVIACKRQTLHTSGLLEYVQSPASLDQIGGLKRMKQWLSQRRDALGTAARDFGLPAPRGVLLLGVQGAGKSLCAKAIATAWQLPLLRMDPGTLYDRYIGESERRLRESLQQADRMAPLVLWIDEIEKGFASAASQSVDGGLSQRMFGTLLTWMQEHASPVFLVATANNIEALPPELLRKGRFDEIFFVDLPQADTRRDILAIHLRKRSRDPQAFDMEQLVRASDGYTGAEIEQAVISALFKAFGAKKTLATAHIAEALAESPPLSVTMSECMAELRSWAQGRCVPAD